VFRAISLDPWLAIDHLNVNQASMDPKTVLPAYVHDVIPIVRPIKDDFALNIALGIGNTGTFGENSLNDLAIPF
jgi:hypothetical protein